MQVSFATLIHQQQLNHSHRSRHIKCDQTIPWCVACQRLGFECPGYPPRARIFETASLTSPTLNDQSFVTNNANIRESFTNTSTDDSRSKCGSTPRAGAANIDHALQLTRGLHQWQLNSEEARAFQYFHECTGSRLRAFNTAADHFFGAYVLQLATVESLIKNQLVLLGMLHAQADSIRFDESQVARSMHEQYFQAYKQLSAKNPAENTVLTLSVCLLFVAMEMLQHNFDAGYLHIRSGIKILRNCTHACCQQDGVTSIQFISRTIENIFAQLAATASRAADSGIVTEPDLTWTHLHLPTVFTCCQEAWDIFLRICASKPFLSNTTAHGPRKFDEPYNHVWLALQRLIPELATKSVREYLLARLLEVHLSIHAIATICQASSDEMEWDQFTGRFREYLAICENICYSDYLYQNSQIGSNLCNYEVRPGVYLPLWLISTSCRDPSLRRRARQLLAIHHKRCGHSDPCLGALCADYFIRAEEHGLTVLRECHDVPSQNRIRLMAVDYSRQPLAGCTLRRWPYTTDQYLQTTVPFGIPTQARTAKLWPIDEAMRNCCFQGLIRLRADGCCCKSHGAL